MHNYDFEVANFRFARQVLRRSRADGISLFLYDKRNGGDILFLHQQNTRAEAMEAYRHRLHKHDSFLNGLSGAGREVTPCYAVKIRENIVPSNTMQRRSDSLYWQGLGNFGYQETASMIYSLSNSLHLVIGMQVTEKRRHLSVDGALATMEDWLNYSSDYIIEQSVDSFRKSDQGSSLQRELARATKREQQVICEVLQGRSNKEIAEVLSLSYYTVENHLRRIYKKFGVHSRTALVSMLHR
ncbi:response regulator transcription factor [Spongiibacter sp. KMU-166]|uniref:Response regulator transcription factor n=1 Tax=Spongiibacter thalassae TaxID=2721624 RepID=A0ABX1GHN3_9GAMM|nr:LuxR C-terminal-related transcriptional regulator [Spongiibacter thalassae]NKI18737.1 response regulator transcription factor [Spongiibacter thalassae]